MNQVVLYTSSACGYCVQAKRLLARHGIAPTEIGIDTDDQKRREMVGRSGRRTVPQIFFGTRHIGGFDELALLEREGKLQELLSAEVN